MMLSCKRMVAKFADSLAREYPELDQRDVEGDLWIVALETMSKWKSRNKSKFSTFLFQKLVWKRLDIISKCINHGRLNREYLRTKCFVLEDDHVDLEFDTTPLFVVPVNSVECSFETLCEEVYRKLGDDEQKLFVLMINPSSALSETVSGRRSKKNSKSRVCYFHYAGVLGWDRGKVDSAVKKIKLAVKEVLRG